MMIERIAPRSRAEAASLNSLSSPRMDPMPNPMIGDISGATSIAPMMVAGESISSPSVAMILESSTKRKKSKSGEESSRSCIWTSARRFMLTGGTIRRHKYLSATRKEDGFFEGGPFIIGVFYRRISCRNIIKDTKVSKPAEVVESPIETIFVILIMFYGRYHQETVVLPIRIFTPL